MKRSSPIKFHLIIFLLASSSAYASPEAVMSMLCPTIVATPAQATVCSGSSLSLTASGGVSYTWTQGGSNPQYTPVIVVTPTQTSLYKVVGVDINGCKDSATSVLVVNPQPTITINSNKPLVCKGGTSTLIASAAAGSYSYQWSSNAGGGQTATVQVTTTVSTIYQVTVTNLATTCSSTKSFQVNVFDPITSLASTGTACAGSPLTFTVNGTPLTTNSFSLSPSTGKTALLGNTLYTLSITSSSNGVICTDSETVSVNGLQLPSVTLSASPTALCENETATLTAGGGITYSWTVPANSNTALVTPGMTNFYSVSGTGTNGCSNSATISIVVSQCTNLSEVLAGNGEVSMFPNPNKGQFYLQSTSEVDLRIITQCGQEVKKLLLNEHNHYAAYICDLPEGLYIIIGTKANSLVPKKLVVTR